MERRFISPVECAQLLGVSRATVRRQIALGHLPVIWLAGRGERKFPRIDLRKLDEKLESEFPKK